MDHEPSLITPERPESWSVLSNIQIQKDPQQALGPTPVIPQRNPAYVDAYFTHFHHRFPIIHRVSHDDPSRGPIQPLLLFSIEMIGAWLVGSRQAKEFAYMRHQYLVAESTLELVSNGMLTHEMVVQFGLHEVF